MIREPRTKALMKIIMLIRPCLDHSGLAYYYYRFRRKLDLKNAEKYNQNNQAFPLIEKKYKSGGKMDIWGRLQEMLP